MVAVEDLKLNVLSTDSQVQSSFDHYDCDGDHDWQRVGAVGDTGFGSAVYGHSDEAALVVEPRVHRHVSHTS